MSGPVAKELATVGCKILHGFGFGLGMGTAFKLVDWKKADTTMKNESRATTMQKEQGDTCVPKNRTEHSAQYPCQTEYPREVEQYSPLDTDLDIVVRHPKE
jgi:hypothetical protein